MNAFATASRPAAVEEAIGGLCGRIDPVRVSGFYYLGLLLVTVGMVLLPVLYIALIALTGYGMYVHAIENISIFTDNNVRFAVFIYLTPLVAGSILIFFMLKPILARQPDDSQFISLDPDDEPWIHEFVGRLCNTVGAPAPSRIDVNCDVNASAGFDSGLWHMLSGKLVLTIGLPLVEGLSVREFAGVLAHEFGHFAQGTGIRLTYVIRSVNAWFARVVYERDAWDEYLANAATQAWAGFGILIVLNIARLMVWLTRRILWVLMMIGHAISSFMLRQMEFDADRYEARIVGSDVFRVTSVKMHLLAFAGQQVYGSIGHAWNEGAISDELPGRILAVYRRIPPFARAQILTEVMAQQTGLFDSHPADRQRMLSADREGKTGLFDCDGSTTELFRDYGSISRRATLDLYKSFMGESLSDLKLIPVEEAKVRRANSDADFAAIRGLTHDLPSPFLRYLSVKSALEQAPIEDPDAMRKTLRGARQRIESWEKDHDACLSIILDLDEELKLLDLYSALADVGITMGLEGTRFQSCDPDSLAKMKPEAIEKRGVYWASFRGQAEEIERRLAIGVGVALGSRGRETLARESLDAKSIPGLLAAAAALEKCAAHVDALRRDCDFAQCLVPAWEANAEDSRLESGIRDLMGRFHEELDALGDSLNVTYPFEHAKGEITIAEYLFPVPKHETDLYGLCQQSVHTLDVLIGLHARVMARLGRISAVIETDLIGLPACSMIFKETLADDTEELLDISRIEPAALPKVSSPGLPIASVSIGVLVLSFLVAVVWIVSQQTATRPQSAVITSPAAESIHAEQPDRAEQDQETNDFDLAASARAGDIAAMESALRAGAQLDGQDRDGKIPLLEAIYYEQREAVIYLLDAGANVNATGRYGETALIEAVLAQDMWAIERLLAAGANLNAATQRGETAMDIARRYSNQEIVALLNKGTGSTTD
jgi:Zn-dependent protease with chaperone function